MKKFLCELIQDINIIIFWSGAKEKIEYALLVMLALFFHSLVYLFIEVWVYYAWLLL